MRNWMLTPMVLLLGAAPPPPPYLPDLVHSWCGDPVETSADRPKLLPGYGGGGFAIATKNPQAQAFFDNGMQLAHAFAHKAAIVAFQQARKLDPDCAMCAWGEAWSSGPTINYGISTDDRKKLADMTLVAERLGANAPAKERALIAALKTRYADDKGDTAFATAMDELAKQSPEDDEIAVLAADALMIASDYEAKNMPRPVALLEGVLKRNPDYTPAIHFYIHATELAGYPEHATPYADKLARLAPAASHLVHMPAHTFFWVGRYADAATTNLRAVQISEDNAKRLKLTKQDEAWTLAYYGHNVSYGLAGSLMSGDAASGLAIARPVAAMAVRTPKLDGGRQSPVSRAYITIARLAPPAEMLALPDPGNANLQAQAIWHYARGEAFARQGDADGVKRELKAIPGSIRPDPSGGVLPKVLKVARLVLAGRYQMIRGKPDKAAKAFAAAAAIEEAAPLGEGGDPPAWWYPVRRDVAAALLAQGDAKGALAAADASLKRRKLDPVSLAVRARADAALGDAKAAAADQAEARNGWRGDPNAIG